MLVMNLGAASGEQKNKTAASSGDPAKAGQTTTKPGTKAGGQNTSSLAKDITTGSIAAGCAAAGVKVGTLTSFLGPFAFVTGAATTAVCVAAAKYGADKVKEAIEDKASDTSAGAPAPLTRAQFARQLAEERGIGTRLRTQAERTLRPVMGRNMERCGSWTCGVGWPPGTVYRKHVPTGRFSVYIPKSYFEEWVLLKFGGEADYEAALEKANAAGLVDHSRAPGGKAFAWLETVLPPGIPYAGESGHWWQDWRLQAAVGVLAVGGGGYTAWHHKTKGGWPWDRFRRGALPASRAKTAKP